MSKSNSPRYTIARISDIAPLECPCGETRRAFVDDSDQIASLHVVEISQDARTHYHRRLTEIYYILDGDGVIELDGRRCAVKPGDAVLIKPGCRHRAMGTLRVLNVAVPAFDPEDEWFD